MCKESVVWPRNTLVISNACMGSISYSSSVEKNAKQLCLAKNWAGHQLLQCRLNRILAGILSLLGKIFLLTGFMKQGPVFWTLHALISLLSWNCWGNWLNETFHLLYKQWKAVEHWDKLWCVEADIVVTCPVMDSKANHQTANS